MCTFFLVITLSTLSVNSIVFCYLVYRVFVRLIQGSFSVQSTITFCTDPEFDHDLGHSAFGHTIREFNPLSLDKLYQPLMEIIRAVFTVMSDFLHQVPEKDIFLGSLVVLLDLLLV